VCTRPPWFLFDATAADCISKEGQLRVIVEALQHLRCRQPPAPWHACEVTHTMFINNMWSRAHRPQNDTLLALGMSWICAGQPQLTWSCWQPRQAVAGCCWKR
jgi:hypothetical protein